MEFSIKKYSSQGQRWYFILNTHLPSGLPYVLPEGYLKILFNKKTATKSIFPLSVAPAEFSLWPRKVLRSKHSPSLYAHYKTNRSTILNVAGDQRVLENHLVEAYKWIVKAKNAAAAPKKKGI